MFSCEFCEISENILFTEHLQRLLLFLNPANQIRFSSTLESDMDLEYISINIIPIEETTKRFPNMCVIYNLRRSGYWNSAKVAVVYSVIFRGIISMNTQILTRNFLEQGL